ncbi:hypothetical protein P4V41_07990 [Fictibacillus nanhaiensis]|uniref:hypothetical protein n=1 Tax=Fictibacillus nanhaiensis TaxID=742169 RepID=UPI002E1B024B|nr:hypothetical protein [Fictibacillus nanhaiensis]
MKLHLEGMKTYCDMYWDNEEVNIDLANRIIVNVPHLINHIKHLEKENSWLYGRLNLISDIIENGRNEVKKFQE